MRPRPVRLHDNREFPLLYVDDEVENLRIFELSFRREFTVLTAQSAEEGMRLLNENPVAVVLSDHKMPGMTGVDFLSRVREIDEQAVRILVTAYGDAEILGQAINDGRIYRYVAKPWNPDDMRLILRRAIERYALDRERAALLRELTLLNRLSRTLHRELDPQRVVRFLLEAAHEELGFDGAAVLLHSGDRRVLRWTGIVPDDDVAARIGAIALDRSEAPGFFEGLEDGKAQSLRVDQMQDFEPPVRQWVAEVSADELLVVPLVGQDGVLGAFAVDNRRGGRRFGADDRTLLDGLATQAVIALENARTVDALRSSRAQVQRADRLGTLGVLAAGLAQEIEAPLAALHDFVGRSAALADAGDPAGWADERQHADAELGRIRDLVSTMQRLGVDDASDPQSAVDVGEIVDEVVMLTEREARAQGVALEVHVDTRTPKVSAVRAQLEQVLLHLVLNAVRTTPRERSVAIGVRPDGPGADAGICIEVRDRGEGFAPDQLERLFDPFEAGEAGATGGQLGMMIAQQIVSRHGGSLEVQSALGEGATFRVRLPVSGA